MDELYFCTYTNMYRNSKINSDNSIGTHSCEKCNDFVHCFSSVNFCWNRITMRHCTAYFIWTTSIWVTHFLVVFFEFLSRLAALPVGDVGPWVITRSSRSQLNAALDFLNKIKSPRSLRATNIRGGQQGLDRAPETLDGRKVAAWMSYSTVGFPLVYSVDNSKQTTALYTGNNLSFVLKGVNRTVAGPFSRKNRYCCVFSVAYINGTALFFSLQPTLSCKILPGKYWHHVSTATVIECIGLPKISKKIYLPNRFKFQVIYTRITLKLLTHLDVLDIGRKKKILLTAKWRGKTELVEKERK